MEEESNGELVFLDTLLKRNNGEISVLVYRKLTHTDQYLHYSSHHETSYKGIVFSSLLNRAYSIITNKDDLHKENARIKQVLKENGYQKSIISKIFRRITNNHSLPESHNNNNLVIISTSNHVFKRKIWDKFTEFTFLKFWNIPSETREISNVQKMNQVNSPQISLVNHTWQTIKRVHKGKNYTKTINQYQQIY